MRYTNNKSLYLPEYNDIAEIQELNNNFEVIDANLIKNWNQNDATAGDYVIGRTHFKEEVNGEVVYHTLEPGYIPNEVKVEWKNFGRASL